MSEHMVRRDLKWRGWFLFSYTLALSVWAYSVLRGWRHEHPHRVCVQMAVHYADIMRTGGFLSPDEPVRFPGEGEK